MIPRKRDRRPKLRYSRPSRKAILPKSINYDFGMVLVCFGTMFKLCFNYVLGTNVFLTYDDSLLKSGSFE